MELPVIWKSFAATVGMTQKSMKDFRRAAQNAGENPNDVIAQFFRDSVSEDGAFCQVSRMSIVGKK